MAEKRPVFSVYDGWMIDIFTSIGAGLVTFVAIFVIYQAIFRDREEGAGGAAAVLLGIICLFWVLARLRRAREARDLEASAEADAPASPAGRARRGGR